MKINITEDEIVEIVREQLTELGLEPKTHLWSGDGLSFEVEKKPRPTTTLQHWPPGTRYWGNTDGVVLNQNTHRSPTIT